LHNSSAPSRFLLCSWFDPLKVAKIQLMCEFANMQMCELKIEEMIQK
jgi:hypothetical protein